MIASMDACLGSGYLDMSILLIVCLLVEQATVVVSTGRSTLSKGGDGSAAVAGGCALSDLYAY